MAKKVKVDKDLCIGCGACTGICPNVFSIGDDGKATASENVSKDDEASVDDAVSSCPVGAITTED